MIDAIGFIVVGTLLISVIAGMCTWVYEGTVREGLTAFVVCVFLIGALIGVWIGAFVLLVGLLRLVGVT